MMYKFTRKRNKEDILPFIILLMDGKTYKEIGRIYGISRQRVQQLVHPNKITTDIIKSRAGGNCEICKKILLIGHIHHCGSKTPEEYNHVNNLMYLCNSCHKALHRKTPKTPKLKIIKIKKIKVKQIKIHRPAKETVVVRMSIKAHELLIDLAEKNNSCLVDELDKILGASKEVDKNGSSIADELDKKLGIGEKNGLDK